MSAAGVPSGGGPELERLFRSARRRDWGVVWVAQALALGLTLLVLIGLCSPGDPHIPVLLYPQLFYWTVASAFAIGRFFAWLFLLGGVLGPIWFYRAVSYYRYGGTRALLLAGLRGTWATQPSSVRARAALRYGILPTWLLLRRGAPATVFERAEPPPFRLPGRVAPLVVLTLAISFNHWPVITSFEMVLCVTPPWVVSLPSWAGPCQFGPARGQASGQSPCHEPGAGP